MLFRVYFLFHGMYNLDAVNIFVWKFWLLEFPNQFWLITCCYMFAFGACTLSGPRIGGTHTEFMSILDSVSGDLFPRYDGHFGVLFMGHCFLLFDSYSCPAIYSFILWNFVP